MTWLICGALCAFQGIQVMAKKIVFFIIFLLPQHGFSSSDIQWRSIGPGGGGWIQSLSFDTIAPTTLYAGGDVAGLYISNDIGISWQAQTHELQDFFVESIITPPVRDGRNTNILIGTQGGIFKWSESESKWVAKRYRFPPVEKYSYSSPIASLAYDPISPSIIYAGIGRPRLDKEGKGQIYRSKDSGETWSLLTPPGTLPDDAIVSDIELTSDNKVILAATSRGLFRSEDKGLSWSISTAGLPHNYCEEVTVSPTHPNISYLTLRTTSRNKEIFNGGVYRSDNWGRTWSRRNNGLLQNQDSGQAERRYTSTYKEINVDPFNQDVVYVGAESWAGGLYKTTNGGITWTNVTRQVQFPNMDYGWLREWGPTITSLAVSPTLPGVLAIGTPGHVFISRNGGGTWTQQYSKYTSQGAIQSSGLETTVSAQGAFDPFDDEKVFLSYLDIGLFSANIKDSFFALERLNAGINHFGDVSTIAPDPQVPNKLWIGLGKQTQGKGTVYKSINGGQSWQLVGSPQSGLPDGSISKIIIDKKSTAQTRTLYVICSGHGIYKSIDDGHSWLSTNYGIPDNLLGSIVDIEINQIKTNQIMSILRGKPSSHIGLYISDNSGNSWSKVKSKKNVFAHVTDLAVSQKDWKTIYITQKEYFDRETQRIYSGGLFKSSDGGKSFDIIYNDYHAQCIEIDANNPKILYLGTNDSPFHDNNNPVGILKSTDAGKTWNSISTNLANNRITSIAISHKNSGKILVGTGGNGFFIANIANILTTNKKSSSN